MIGLQGCGEDCLGTPLPRCSKHNTQRVAGDLLEVTSGATTCLHCWPGICICPDWKEEMMESVNPLFLTCLLILLTAVLIRDR